MNLNNDKTTQRVMHALRDEYPEDPLPARMPNDLAKEIADRVNTTWKDVNTTENYVKSCASARRRLASPAGQHLLSVYKSTGDWNMAWTDAMAKYPGMLGSGLITRI